jgi:hypothetical protein
LRENEINEKYLASYLILKNEIENKFKKNSNKIEFIKLKNKFQLNYQII